MTPAAATGHSRQDVEVKAHNGNKWYSRRRARSMAYRPLIKMPRIHRRPAEFSCNRGAVAVDEDPERHRLLGHKKKASGTESNKGRACARDRKCTSDAVHHPELHKKSHRLRTFPPGRPRPAGKTLRVTTPSLVPRRARGPSRSGAPAHL